MVIEIPLFERVDVIRNILVAEILMQQEKMIQKEVLLTEKERMHTQEKEKLESELKCKNTAVYSLINLLTSSLLDEFRIKTSESERFAATLLKSMLKL